MKNPTVLAFTRTINPGHMLMYSAPAVDVAFDKLTPVGVRDEPLRGLNATMKSTEAEKSQAILSVVESAQLAAGDSVLVLVGKVLVRHQMSSPHSCNEREFFEAQKLVVDEARDAGDFRELAKRYAITMAMGSWGWRNALEAESLKVTVYWTVRGERVEVSFVDLLPAEEDMFNLDSPEYAEHKEALTKLADALETVLSTYRFRGVNFHMRADIVMGLGARVYPSQEWGSTEMKKSSLKNWEGGKGVTRFLAKLKMADGRTQAIINDRKAGNALRVIDTWYPGATANSPIAVEPYGANSHEGTAFRAGIADSVFGAVGVIAKGEKLTASQRLFYLATCIRGGVFGGAE